MKKSRVISKKLKKVFLVLSGNSAENGGKERKTGCVAEGNFPARRVVAWLTNEIKSARIKREKFREAVSCKSREEEKCF